MKAKCDICQTEGSKENTMNAISLKSGDAFIYICDKCTQIVFRYLATDAGEIGRTALTSAVYILRQKRAGAKTLIALLIKKDLKR